MAFEIFVMVDSLLLRWANLQSIGAKSPAENLSIPGCVDPNGGSDRDRENSRIGLVVPPFPPVTPFWSGPCKMFLGAGKLVPARDFSL